MVCYVRSIVFDGGGENKGVVRELMKRHNTRNVPIAAYHPQSNGLIERGYQPIIDALAKLGPHWVKHLPAVLWADRITTRRSTGFTPYKLVFGQDCVSPVETEAMTWAMVNWKQI